MILGSPRPRDIRPWTGWAAALVRSQAFRLTHAGHRAASGGRLNLNFRCCATRDRSWYSRSNFERFRSGYSYFLTEDEELPVVSAIPQGSNPVASTLPVVGGYLRRGTAKAAVTGGRRWVGDRDGAEAPSRVVLEVDFADGGHWRLAECSVSSMAIAANTCMLSWMSLVEWECGDAAVFGEDQEIWSHAAWRRFRTSAPHEVPVRSGYASEAASAPRCDK
jgi:hypothetical protein